MLRRIEGITSHEAYEYTLDKSCFFHCVREDRCPMDIKTDKEVSMEEMNQYLKDNIVLAEDGIRIDRAIQIMYEDMAHNPMNLIMER